MGAGSQTRCLAVPVPMSGGGIEEGLVCVSYNTWFELGHCFEERTCALLQLLEASQGHIIALQEVTPQLLARLTQVPRHG